MFLAQAVRDCKLAWHVRRCPQVLRTGRTGCTCQACRPAARASQRGLHRETGQRGSSEQRRRAAQQSSIKSACSLSHLFWNYIVSIDLNCDGCLLVVTLSQPARGTRSASACVRSADARDPASIRLNANCGWRRGPIHHQNTIITLAIRKLRAVSVSPCTSCSDWRRKASRAAQASSAR